MHPTSSPTFTSSVFKPGMLIFSNKKQTILAINDEGSLVPLYLIPSLGLQPGDYTKLAERCPAEQPMYVFQYQIDDYKAESSDLVREIAARFVEGVLKSRPEGPVAICAWSAGTIVALEVAQQLNALDRDVALLAAIDWAPENTGVTNTRTSMVLNLRCWFRDEWQSQQSFQSFVRHLLKKYVDMSKKKIRLEDSEIAHPPIVEEILKANPALTSKKREFILRFYHSLCDYVPQKYDGKVLAFVATHESHKKVERKWQMIAPHLKTIDVKGTHNTIVRGADVEPLAAQLWEELAVARTPTAYRSSDLALGNGKESGAVGFSNEGVQNLQRAPAHTASQRELACQHVALAFFGAVARKCLSNNRALFESSTMRTSTQLNLTINETVRPPVARPISSKNEEGEAGQHDSHSISPAFARWQSRFWSRIQYLGIGRCADPRQG